MKEKVSALLDGALDEAASARMLDSLKRDGGLRREWDHYSLIGDVLRDEPVMSADFTSRLMLRLDDEPTVLAPARVEPRRVGWARHFMPIAASVMGVAAVGWVAMTLNAPGSTSAPLAALKKPVPAVAVADASKTARLVAAEPSEREYLIAHQAMAPSAAMPGVAQYVRSVSDTRMAGE
ncbi:MAG: sigma-E factor negative regulatory protein [Zoogloea sp.]|uniref:sigma-E factor negative regulatory protein n=1 Tax=Zoogloea sp. TaxID=49181 RepID=UPI002638B839|nr:sigma-E factor negative regulatory protein [Zoogloea sp.]MDD2988604.1 sigma-E factor negative regulatory protein [Zoogloea sp.]